MGYVLTNRAMDIITTEEELCFILGYLATPGRIKYIEAQVPYGKETMFRNAYPGQNYDEMKLTSDKQSFQFRIILGYNGNCPSVLADALTSGGGAFYNNCISRGRFIEKIINEYGEKYCSIILTKNKNKIEEEVFFIKDLFKNELISFGFQLVGLIF